MPTSKPLVAHIEPHTLHFFRKLPRPPAAGGKGARSAPEPSPDFVLDEDEVAFVRALFAKKANLRVYRPRRRASAGSFVLVDMSRQALDAVAVVALKKGAPLQTAWGEAGADLRRAGEAIDEIARHRGGLYPGGEARLLVGDASAVLAALGVRA